MISSGDQQVNCLSSSDYSTLIHPPERTKSTTAASTKTKPNKSSKISFLNSAFRTINRSSKSECSKRTFNNKNCKSESKKTDHLSSTSVYLEEHKGMDWRLQQLGYQLPEQDERLLADPHLSNELKFLRTQQKLCSIPVKLYIINNNNETDNTNESSTNSVSSEQHSKCCNRCEQMINKVDNKVTYCVQAELTNLNLSTKTNQPTSSAGTAKLNSSSSNCTPVYVYYHIDCLQCATCSEILVDFRAFLDPRTKFDDVNKKIKLDIYCSRHFLELFKPRCEMCEELIFDKKCTQAEGKAWHVAHFACFQCRMPLGGQQYKMADLNQKRSNDKDNDKMKLEDLHKPTAKEVRPFCLACCDQLFGEYCARCEKLISCDQNPVKFEKYFWHATAECFHCDTCGVSLVNSDYLPSSSAKQVYCSTKCAQSLQAKDLNNLNSGLMKLNDRLRSNQHKPTLNSVKEEESEEQTDNSRQMNSTKVEYENSSMFHLAKSTSSSPNNNDHHSFTVDDEEHKNLDSSSSNRSSNRSLSSLSLLFSSSPDSPNNDDENSVAKNQSKESLSIESVCSTESNQLNSSTQTMIAKESSRLEQIISNHSRSDKDAESIVDLKQTTNDALSVDQKLIHYSIVDNKPYTRTSIIIDNLNTLSTMQILDDELVTDKHSESCLSSSTQSTKSLSQSSQSSQDSQNSVQSNSISVNSPTESNTNSSNANQVIYSTLSKKELNPVDSTTEKTSLLDERSMQNIQHMFNSVNSIQPTHYSTLPTRRTQRKPFQYEERNTSTHQMNHLHHHYPLANNSSTHPVTYSSQSTLNNNSINEVGLPVLLNHTNRINHQQFDNVNLSNFVNCTLPRRQQDSYLNGVQSVSIQKLNAVMLQSKFNRYNSSCNLSTNTSTNNNSTNSDFSTTSSSNKHTSSLSNHSSHNIALNNLNSHSVVVSEDQIESLNSKLVVKPLPNTTKQQQQLPVRTPPLPPVDQKHGFIKKWSTTSPTSISQNNNLMNQLTDLPVIQENHLITSATPSLGSSIDIQSNDTNEKESINQTNDGNLISIQNFPNFSSSNNSLNTMNLIQTNLNSSNSASLISATSSVSSTMSSNETTPQSNRTSLSNHHNRPDVILNPIETIKQLKQKQRELKMKEKMLKKAEQQQSIDQSKPKIVEEKLKTSTPSVKQNDELNKFLHKNNTRKLSTIELNSRINQIEQMPAVKLSNTVSNSLSSLTNRTTTQLLMKPQQLKPTSQLMPAYRSQPNLHSVQSMSSSNGETCSNSSTPDQLNRIEQLNQINHLNELNKLNHLKQSNHQSPSSQYSPSVSVNDTDSSSVMNSVEMDNIVQFEKNGSNNNLGHKKQQRQPTSSSLKDSQFKNCESSSSNLKQKSVSFDPNVIENENNKAPKRLSRKAMNGHYSSRYTTSSSSSSSSSLKKKYHHHDDSYESHRRKRNYQRDHHVHYKSSSRRHSSRRHHYDEDLCSTCSSSSCSSSSFCSSSDEEDNRSYSCHGRKSQSKNHNNIQQQNTKKSTVDKLSQLTSQNVATTSIPAEMVKLMQQQQLIIQQQLAQMNQQPQVLKQQRYLKNNTNESCVIS